MAGHTPIPWVAVRDEHDDRFWDVRDVETNCSIIDTENSGCGSDPSPDDVFFTEANAAFIVRACNAHDALLAALEGILKTHKCGFRGHDCSPGHCHDKPGQWDDGSGPCTQCQDWMKAKELVAKARG